VKVIVAPPTAVLGDVSISGVEAASQPQLVSTKSWRLQIVDVRKSLKLLDV